MFPDPLQVQKGSILAPAGCGKTHLIASSLARHAGPKPILVLTHTNAGVAALKKRLDAFGVEASKYRLATIDGWAKRLISLFPMRSGHDTSILEVANPRSDYPAIKQHALHLLKTGHVADILQASYSRLFVDEYQDCMMQQHQIVGTLSDIMPTCVFGDDLQCIFSWSGPKPNWEQEVLRTFPLVGELTVPYRWVNVGRTTLGQWLLDIRGDLRAGRGIDLREAPTDVEWQILDGTDDEAVYRHAAATKPPEVGGSVLIICDSKRPPRHQEIARVTPGAVVVEAVDLTDFIRFAENFDFQSASAVDQLIDFAGTTMTGVDASGTKRRVASLRSGSARKAASDAEEALLSFVDMPSPASANAALVAINRQTGVRQHRPAILSACLKALNSCSDEAAFRETSTAVREQQRVVGREIKGRAVGSTLLLKGLEADVAVLLDTEEFGVEDLYVALTRGAKKIVVCSHTPLLNPQ